MQMPSDARIDAERAHFAQSLARCAPNLSAEERRIRADAVRFANASLALEGFKMSLDAQVRADRFIAGEIDLAEFVNAK